MYSKVYVEITNICNMACSFCHGHTREKRQMSLADFSHILDKLQGYTQYIYYHLMGEPLTHPDLKDFLKLAKEKGFRSIITTNGTLLDRHGDDILQAGVHKVSISLHSFEGADVRTHHAYLEKICAFADKAAETGTLVSLRLWNQGFDEGRNDTTLEYLQNRLAGEWAENSRGYRIREKLYLEWGDRFAWPDKNAPVQSDNVFCYGLKDHFGILCDGTVVPCCLDSDGILALGNIFENDVATILQSPRATAMAEGFRCRKATEDLCRRCGYAQRFSK